MPIYKFSKSTRKNKRFMVENPDGKTTHFGSATGKAFIDHGDEDKKEAWIARHSKLDEDWTYSGRDTAGFWSRWLMWSADNLKDAIKLIKKRFGIKVKM